MKRSSRGYGLQEAGEEERSRRTALSDWTNDSQDPNDPTSESRERIEIRNGYPVRFKCLDASPELTNSLGVSSLEVPFDYELTMARKSASTFPENMRAFEWSVLWNVVEAIGLGKCDFTKQTLVMANATATVVDEHQNHRSRQRQRRAQQRSDVVSVDSSPSYILSMTSDAEDKIDTTTVFCQFSGETDSSTVCVPMKGAMTILFTGDQPKVMERFVLGEVQGVMEQSIVLVADIQSASYVGDREARNREVPRGIDVGSLQDSDNQGPSFSGIGLIGVAVCISFVAAAVIGLLVSLSLRKKRVRHVQELEKSSRHEVDAAGGDAFPDLEKQIRTTTSLDSFEGRDSAVAKDFSIKEQSREITAKDTLPTESSEFIANNQPEMVEQDGLMFVQSTPNNIQSVYLASNRQRKRKKGGRKRKKSLRERVAVAPSGIEPILEMDGDFESALCDKECGNKRGCDLSWSTDEEGGSSKREGIDSSTGSPFPATSLHLLHASTTAPLVFFAENDANSPNSAAADVAAIRSIRETPKIRRLQPSWI